MLRIDQRKRLLLVAGLPVLALGALAAAGLPGCGQPGGTLPSASAEPTAAPPIVEVAEAHRRELKRQIHLPATIEGYEQVDLMARVEGYVDQVHVDIGSRVEAGALLAELDAPELQADVAQKETLVAQARAELNSRLAELEQVGAQQAEQQARQRFREIEVRRLGNLVRRGALEQEVLDSAQYELEAVRAGLDSLKAQIATAEARVEAARAGIDAAAAELAQAQTLSGFTKLRAPFAGVVTQRSVDRGTFVRPATSGSAVSLFSLAGLDRVRLVISVPMESAGWLDVGDAAVLHNIQGRPGERFDGTVSRYAMAFGQGARMMRAEIDLSNRAESLGEKRPLEPGLFGTVTLTLETLDCPTLPPSALAADSEGDYVMVVRDGKAQRRPVRVVFRDAEICGLSGIEPGERCVVKEVERLKDQQAVVVAEPPAP